MTKILVLILTSRDPLLARLAVDSVRIARRSARHDYTVGVVINSLRPGYFQEVAAMFARDAAILLFDTPSTGMPGPGHNAVIDTFRNQPGYDYLLMIDGDDLLYPSALYQIERALEQEPGLDLLGIQTNDSIRRNILPNELKLPLVSGAWLYGWYDKWPNSFDEAICHIYPNPFITAPSKCYTPARLIFFSRAAVDSNLVPAIRYTPDCPADDLLPFLQALMHSKQATLNIRFTSSSYIYLCNRLAASSASKSDAPNFAEEADRTVREDVERQGIPASVWELIPRSKHLVLPPPPFFREFDKIRFCNRYLDMLLQPAARLNAESDPFKRPSK